MLLLSILFWGLAASVAIGVAITRKRINESLQSGVVALDGGATGLRLSLTTLSSAAEDTLELGMLPQRAKDPIMVAVAGDADGNNIVHHIGEETETHSTATTSPLDATCSGGDVEELEDARYCSLTMLASLAAAPAFHVPQQQWRQMRRRALLATTAAAALPQLPSVADDSDDLVALGTVRIKPGNEAVGATEASGALYVTVRVIPQNNVTAGKVPPLATVRFASPIAFPYEVQLRNSDLTPEFAGVPRKDWETQDLIFSARWDTDGTAATRGPDDLVGRGVVEKFGKLESSQWRRAEVVLEGRGLTGRLLTGGK